MKAEGVLLIHLKRREDVSISNAELINQGFRATRSSLWRPKTCLVCLFKPSTPRKLFIVIFN